MAASCNDDSCIIPGTKIVADATTNTEAFDGCLKVTYKGFAPVYDECSDNAFARRQHAAAHASDAWYGDPVYVGYTVRSSHDNTSPNIRRGFQHVQAGPGGDPNNVDHGAGGLANGPAPGASVSGLGDSDPNFALTDAFLAFSDSLMEFACKPLVHQFDGITGILTPAPMGGEDPDWLTHVECWDKVNGIWADCAGRLEAVPADCTATPRTEGVAQELAAQTVTFSSDNTFSMNTAVTVWSVGQTAVLSPGSGSGNCVAAGAYRVKAVSTTGNSATVVLTGGPGTVATTNSPTNANCMISRSKAALSACEPTAVPKAAMIGSSDFRIRADGSPVLRDIPRIDTYCRYCDRPGLFCDIGHSSEYLRATSVVSSTTMTAPLTLAANSDSNDGFYTGNLIVFVSGAGADRTHTSARRLRARSRSGLDPRTEADGVRILVAIAACFFLLGGDTVAEIARAPRIGAGKARPSFNADPKQILQLSAQWGGLWSVSLGCTKQR